jgi:hypothetical protein
MQLREIDKTRYRKHLRIVFAGIAVAMLIIALIFSTLIIHLFSTPEVSHFWFNLAGVVFAAIIVAYVLNKYRQHPFMTEVAYVWDLKQQLNKIYRKQRKIEEVLQGNDHNAMVIINFMYRGSKQLYLLDDNAITMEDLLIKIQVLDKRMLDAGLSTSTDAYSPTMLERF